MRFPTSCGELSTTRVYLSLSALLCVYRGHFSSVSACLALSVCSKWERQVINLGQLWANEWCALLHLSKHSLAASLAPPSQMSSHFSSLTRVPFSSFCCWPRKLTMKTEIPLCSGEFWDWESPPRSPKALLATAAFLIQHLWVKFLVLESLLWNCCKTYILPGHGDFQQNAVPVIWAAFSSWHCPSGLAGKSLPVWITQNQPCCYSMTYICISLDKYRVSLD